MEFITEYPDILGCFTIKFTDDELRKSFAEISAFRRSSIFNYNEKLRSLVNMYIEETGKKKKTAQHDVEDALLYEMARRFYNETAEPPTNAGSNIPSSLSFAINVHLTNPNTRVYIKHNKDTGKWLYSVVVADSDDFWLDSFKTEDEAKAYIAHHNLKMAKEGAK